MDNHSIPTVDLSPFFNGDEDGMTKAKVVITHACSEYGFFQIRNHGVPLRLMDRALELSKVFFEYSREEKLMSSPMAGAPLPAGYNQSLDNCGDKNEYLFMFPPGSSFNVFPRDPLEFKEVLEEMFTQFVKLGSLMDSIFNDCLGLPPNFLKEYNHDRNWDFMAALRYFPASASDTDNTGLSEHEDGNCFSFVFQDDVGGLEVLKDGVWIPVIPIKDNLVVNIGDVIQVLSNNKFKSGTHKVVRKGGRSRHSFAFLYSLLPEKWIEPLPKFTEEIGEKAKYIGFFYKDYQKLRMRNKTHPSSRPEDVIHITHYAIPSQDD